MMLKKENQGNSNINNNDSLIMNQPYSNTYGMRQKLRDIENKMNSVEGSSRSKINIRNGQHDSNSKSIMELGSNSLRILPKLNNSFL